jgi:GGDEF domain-containing protein
MDAGTRDARAQRRDELAAALDAEMEALERADTAGVNGSPPQLALRARRRAAAARESSARARAAAAEDRAAAYADRVRAAEDREAAAQGELALERLDHLTGALRHDYFIARLGGDEFGCVLYQQTQSDLSERFAQIAAEVAERHDGARITVGFADARNEDRPEQLIARAEAAMNAARRERAAASQRQSGGEAG